MGAGFQIASYSKRDSSLDVREDKLFPEPPTFIWTVWSAGSSRGFKKSWLFLIISGHMFHSWMFLRGSWRNRGFFVCFNCGKQKNMGTDAGRRIIKSWHSWYVQRQQSTVAEVWVLESDCLSSSSSSTSVTLLSYTINKRNLPQFHHQNKASNSAHKVVLRIKKIKHLAQSSAYSKFLTKASC